MQISNFLSLNHGKYELFVFKLQAKDFIKYSKIERRYDNTKNPEELNSDGVQRKLNLKKVTQIREYFLEQDSTIPVSFIVNICTENNNFGIKSKAKIEPKKIILNEKDLIVIDGQHRLAALDYNKYEILDKKYKLEDYEKKKLDDLEVIIVGYKDISLLDMADIFITINYNQRRVSKSIIYDLLNLVESDFNQINRRQEIRIFGGVSQKEFRAASIVDDLGNDSNSYWQNLIKVEGGKGKTIEKGSFVENLSKIFGKGRIFGDENKNPNEVIYNIINDFYTFLLENIYINSKDNEGIEVKRITDEQEIDILSLFRSKECFLSKPSGVGIILDEMIFDRIIKEIYDFDNGVYNEKIIKKLFKKLTFDDFIPSNYKGQLSSRAGYKQVVDILVNKIW